MNLFEYLSPLRRRLRAFGLALVLCAGVFTALTFLVPESQRTTIYFSVKPTFVPGADEVPEALDPVESASKVAEAIAGWAKDPGFRQAVLDEAEVYIPNFKRKLAARKQNRVNVFWTLKLGLDEAAYSEKVTTALMTVFEQRFTELNAESAAPFAVTPASFFSEPRTYPLSWRIVAALVLALCTSILGLYLWEVFANRVSFLSQVAAVFPESPLLRLHQPLGKHDPKLLEQFILTFESPRLITTFRGADEFFSLAPLDSIDDERDIPILLVRLGQTNMRDLHNFAAIFGDEIGVVVFEK